MTIAEILARDPAGRGCIAPANVDWNSETPVFHSIRDAVEAGYLELANCEVLPGKNRPLPHCHGSALTKYQKAILREVIKELKAKQERIT